MGPNKVRFLEDLPEWFSLNNYQAVESYSSIEWYWEMELRRQLYTTPFTAFFNQDRYGVFGFSSCSSAGRHLDSLVRLTKNLHESIVEINNEFIFTKPVFSTLYGDSLRNIAVGRGLVFECADDVRQPVSSFIKTVSVDVSAPDDLLCEAFKAWLQREREKLPDKNITKKMNRRPHNGVANFTNEGVVGFAQDDFTTWWQSGVLPYIDLFQWSLLSGVDVPLSVLGDALLPGNNQGNKAERIRKTTKVKARQIAGSLSGRILQSQASNECWKNRNRNT